MRITRALFALATMTAGLAYAAPSIAAFDVGCQRATDVSTLPGGASTRLTPSGADALGWTPECIIIQNGQTVTFTQRDLAGHGVMTDCFRLGTMDLVARPATTLKIEHDEVAGLLYTRENGRPDLCDGLAVVGDGTLTIDYWCDLHGKEMPGRIVVEI